MSPDTGIVCFPSISGRWCRRAPDSDPIRTRPHAFTPSCLAPPAVVRRFRRVRLLCLHYPGGAGANSRPRRDRGIPPRRQPLRAVDAGGQPAGLAAGLHRRLHHERAARQLPVGRVEEVGCLPVAVEGHHQARHLLAGEGRLDLQRHPQPAAPHGERRGDGVGADPRRCPAPSSTASGTGATRCASAPTTSRATRRRGCCGPTAATTGPTGRSTSRRRTSTTPTSGATCTAATRRPARTRTGCGRRSISRPGTRP